MQRVRIVSCCSKRTTLSLQLRKHHTNENERPPIIHIPKANVYRFGDPNTAPPVFRDLQWTVHEDEAWAVIGSGSGEKTTLFQTLLGHLRISPFPPPPGGLFPFLTTHSLDPYTSLALVSFSSRPRSAATATPGAFYDFSARYGGLRDEDRVTLRQASFPETIPPESPELTLEREHDRSRELGEAQMSEPDKVLFETLVRRMSLSELLDLPIIALSNGQTRRAKIVKAILRKPELLLLDEPLTGLDVQNRPTVLEVLHSLHTARAPRVMLGLRTQDPVPEWITHVAFVKGGGKVVTGFKDEVLPTIERIAPAHPPLPVMTAKQVQGQRKGQERGELLVDMRGVNVKYGTRVVLKDINWQIRKGERWHLQGPNGSGKTTLLSLLTGSHPQSYTQHTAPSSHLSLHGHPRPHIPTVHLASLTSLLSPELFDAFPRRPESRMTVWDAVGTGFDGGYVPLGREGVGVGVMRPVGEEERRWRVGRVQEVLRALGPHTWHERQDGTAEEAGVKAEGEAQAESESVEAFAKRVFADLPMPAQRMVLLMRALVSRAPLVLLDEAESGMGEGMGRAVRRYLREGGGVGEEQGVVVVTHWEEEVPWGREDGVRRFKLDGGVGRVVE